MSAELYRDAPGVQTIWRVTLSTGKAYLVTTYPDSAVLHVRSASSGRSLTGHQRDQLASAIKSEISAALAAS